MTGTAFPSCSQQPRQRTRSEDQLKGKDGRVHGRRRNSERSEKTAANCPFTCHDYSLVGVSVGRRSYRWSGAVQQNTEQREKARGTVLWDAGPGAHPGRSACGRLFLELTVTGGNKERGQQQERQ